MIELSPSEFQSVTPIFSELDHSVAIVSAVLEGNSPGQIYVDNRKMPAVALLYAEGAFFFISGDENYAGLEDSFVPLLFDQVLPQIIDKELVIFSFTPAWREKLDLLLGDKGAIQISRKVFRFNPEKFAVHANWRANIPIGFVVREIDSILAEQFPAYQAVVDAVSKRFGVCLLQGDEIVSECNAIFVGGGEAEIDIHTNERFQGQGFARLTASAFIELCLSRGLRPAWSCWPERHASCALARRLGFEEIPDVPAHLWFEGIKDEGSG